MKEFEDVEKNLKSIVSYVIDCQARVNKGEIMDLQGLDDNVISLCDDIAALPEEDGQRLEEQMKSLILNLEELAKEIREKEAQAEGFDGIGDDIDSGAE